MSVGIDKSYEVTITVRPAYEPWAQPVAIKFSVSSQFANPRHWKDAMFMAILAKRVLSYFAQVYFKAAEPDIRGRS